MGGGARRWRGGSRVSRTCCQPDEMVSSRKEHVDVTAFAKAVKVMLPSCVISSWSKED